MLTKQLKAYLKTIAPPSLSLPKIIWDMSTLVPTAIFNGSKVTCQMFGAGVKSLQELVAKGLSKVLFVTRNELATTLSLQDLKEEIGSTTAGQNFTNYNALSFRKLRSRVLTEIRKENSIRSWFESVDGLVGPLLTLVHLAAGMPARSTEYVPLISVNDKGHRQRSVFITMGRLCFVFEYNKASSQSSKCRTICRFLDPESSLLWVWFLGVVQPMYW
jgi:hypothetical protein